MSSEESSGRFRVHQQSNGARVIVTETFDHEDPPSDVEDEVRTTRRPTVRETRAARAAAPRPTSKRRKAAGSRWRGAVLAGAAAAVACSVAYNAIVLVTYMDFKLLAAASGTAIGLAVRGSAPPGISPSDTRPRWLALGLTYLCMASVYTPWFYDWHLHPEEYEVLADAPEVSGPVDTLDRGASRAPEAGRHAYAAAAAVGESLVLPVMLLTYTDVLGLIFLLVALAQAWKFSA